MSVVNEKAQPTLLHHQAFRWIGKKRGEWTAALAAIVVLHALFEDGVSPLNLLDPRPSARWLVCWMLLLVGVAVRIWAAGNLRKKTEVTMTGVYAMVRHPLYLGTLLIYLGAFVALGNLYIGGPALIVMILVVFYPRIRQEEALLLATFPDRMDEYKRTPLIVPNPLLFRSAIETDKFSLSMASSNLGLRSAWVVVLVPLLLEVVTWLKAAYLAR